MKNWGFIIGGALLLLGSCEKKIDTQSDQAYASSVRSIERGLSSQEEKDFKTGIKLLEVKDFDFKHGDSFQEKREELYKRLQGKSVEAVIREGENVREDIRQIGDKRAEELYKILSRRKAKEEQNQKVLDKLIVRESLFYKGNQNTPDSTLMDVPVVEITVRNETNFTLKKVKFSAILTNPGRKAPWLKTEIVYEIPQGIKAGQEQTWYLKPDPDSDLGKFDLKMNDPLLILQTKYLETSSGEEFSSGAFTKGDQQALDALTAVFPELEPDVK